MENDIHKEHSVLFAVENGIHKEHSVIFAVENDILDPLRTEPTLDVKF